MPVKNTGQKPFIFIYIQVFVQSGATKKVVPDFILDIPWVIKIESKYIAMRSLENFLLKLLWLGLIINYRFKEISGMVNESMIG
jgi:hypothetical protein